MDLELLIFSGDDVRSFALPASGTVTIGRGEQSALRNDDPSVSRNHAVLRVADRLVVEDLGSANGTMVRGKVAPGSPSSETLNVRHLLKREATLSVGDSILFGTTSVVVRHKPTAEIPDLTGVNPGVVIRDPAMRAIYEQAALAARSPLNVLILGETGVGKEVLAHAIHAHSRRASGPFLGLELRGADRNLCRRAQLRSVTRRGRSRAPSNLASACSRRRMGALCSSTRSASWRWVRKRRCSGCWSSAR